MEQVVRTLLDLLQQGIAAIFRFLELLWTWATGQVAQLIPALGNIGSLPLWKQVLLGVAVLGVVALLLRAGKELWDSGERLLAAFVTLLGAIVHVLPWVVGAGLVAGLSVWIVNNVNF